MNTRLKQVYTLVFSSRIATTDFPKRDFYWPPCEVLYPSTGLALDVGRGARVGECNMWELLFDVPGGLLEAILGSN